jgi:hypothetical protein
VEELHRRDSSNGYQHFEHRRSDIGSVTGNALDFTAGSITLTNSGNIRSISTNAIDFDGANNSLTNSGLIESNQSDAIQFDGDSNTLINTGTIRGDQGVDFDNNGVNSIFNAGTMLGTGDAGLDGSDGQELIINNGLIQGTGGNAVELGSGNDVYDGRNGSVVGDIEGAGGDDIIFGGLGGETIRAGSENDQVFGGGGGDIIRGEAGADLILGGAGGDIIRGGLGGDLFGFNVGDNGDLIELFNEGGVRDGFDLRGYFDATGFAGNNPRAAGILQVLQNGADTDVYLHGAFAFRIQNVVAAAIDDTYFLFQ